VRAGLDNTGHGLAQCGHGGKYTIIENHREWLDSEIDNLNWQL
jgi:hypothetical protein